jgi:hypothetical protein
MNATTTDSILTSMIGDISDILSSGLPIVLGLVGALIGLMYMLRFIFSKLGSARR